MSESKKEVCIIYFSRTGHSERIANDLAAKIPSDVIKISEEFSRAGIGAYWTSFNEHYFGRRVHKKAPCKMK